MKKILNLLTISVMTFGLIPMTTAAVEKSDIQTRTKAAKEATENFLKKLGGTLKKEMKAGGPEAAVKVCRNVAPNIANDISLKNGWQVTRVSNKPRNSMLSLPDSWEQTVLQNFKNRAAKGEKYSEMFQAEVVEEPAGKSFRYMKAIGVATQCLSCHGSSEQIPENMQAQFKDLYPHDKATGFKVGDLRGAVSIKQQLSN